MLGLTLRWTSIPSRRTPSRFISTGLMGHLTRMQSLSYSWKIINLHFKFWCYYDNLMLNDIKTGRTFQHKATSKFSRRYLLVCIWCASHDQKSSASQVNGAYFDVGYPPTYLVFVVLCITDISSNVMVQTLWWKEKPFFDFLNPTGYFRSMLRGMSKPEML